MNNEKELKGQEAALQKALEGAIDDAMRAMLKADLINQNLNQITPYTNFIFGHPPTLQVLARMISEPGFGRICNKLLELPQRNLTECESFVKIFVEEHIREL